MFVKALSVIGLCLIIAACGTGGGEYAFRGETKAHLGVRYLFGRGVPKNNEKAFYYFSQAANEGDPFAQNELAYLYASGKGTPKNNEKAFYYYQKAAHHGLASAQYNLGLMFLHGLGTEKNPEKARIWFQKSAKAGFEPAQIALKQG